MLSSTTNKFTVCVVPKSFVRAVPVERTSCLGVWGTEKGGALDLWFCSKSRVAGRSRFRDHVGVEDVQWGC